MNLLNSDNYHGIGFRGSVPTGMDAVTLGQMQRESPEIARDYFATIKCGSWADITVKIDWKGFQESTFPGTIRKEDHSPLWHEYHDQAFFLPEKGPGSSPVTSGTQTITIKWACKDSESSVVASPFIRNGPQRASHGNRSPAQDFGTGA